MIYVFLAEGFEEVEALAPCDILHRGKIPYKTVGVGSKTVKSSHNISVTADIELNETSFEDLDGIVLPGGMPGTLNLEKDETVQKFIDYCAKNNKLLCAICAAPSIFAHKGLLKDKEATSFPGFLNEKDCKKISEKGVVRDKNIITAKGAGVSLMFGAVIASEFIGEEKAMAILSAIQYER